MQIEIADLHKSFGPLRIFEGFDLSIAPGEICVIMGRSGTGKSVLQKHLTGLLKPDQGSIKIDGEEITTKREKELFPVRRRFGMIFQNGGMLQSLNVAQNVALPLVETQGCSLAEVMDHVSEKLEMVGLEGREKQSVTTLSGGQQKRVAIARALIQGADCLLFDEPTAGLDPPISKTVDDVIVQMNEKTKATMIVVTHDLVSAFTIADRVCLLHEGKLVEVSAPEDFLESKEKAVQEFLARGIAIPEPRTRRRSAVVTANASPNP